MKFLPFKTLIEMLKFCEDAEKRQHIATVDGEAIAFASFVAVTSEEAMDAWKTEVRRAILWHSSTVVLRTACGCERIVDLKYKDELRSLMIPIVGHRGTIAHMPTDADCSIEPGLKREFRWHQRSHKNGAKLMEEVL